MSVGGVCVALSLARGGCGGWRAWLVGVCGSVAGSGFSGGVCRPLGKGGPHVLTPTRVRARACSLGGNSIGDAGATKFGEALQQNSTLTEL